VPKLTGAHDPAAQSHSEVAPAIPGARLLPRSGGDFALVLGRRLFALGWIGLGFAHFMFGDFVAGRAPGWPEGWPGQLVVAYLTGAAFIVAGAAILSGRRIREAALLTGGLLAAWALLRHIPIIVQSGFLTPAWTQAGKAFVFTGGALAIAASATPGDLRTGTGAGPFRSGLVALGFPFALGSAAGFHIMTGIQHYLYAPFVASLIPTWFPGNPLYWTWVTGAALIAGGVGLLVPRTRAWAGGLTGSMLLAWFFIVHVNQEVTRVGDGLAVFEVLVVAGVLFLLAGRTHETASP
jgi:uncharacterized membrane protein